MQYYNIKKNLYIKLILFYEIVHSIINSKNILRNNFVATEIIIKN